MKPKTNLPVRNLTENLVLAGFMLFLLLVLLVENAIAQNPTRTTQKATNTRVTAKGQAGQNSLLVQVETKDGNTYIGHLIEQDAVKIRLRTEKMGDLNFLRTEIDRITTIQSKQMVKGVYWFDNPQATRHFWAPNGYGLKKGEAYYQNVWILFNQVNVGVTNNFSLGAGLFPGFLFGGASTPMWIGPKFSIPVSKDKFNIGVGGLLGTSSINEKGSGFGLLYGMTTFGSRDTNFTIGLGYGYSDGKMNSSPMINFSAIVRVSARGYFLTENYYLGSDSKAILISLGGRRIVNRTGIDFGLFIPIASGMTSLVAIPWLGLTAPLHKK